jgi:hypothetical protein
MLRGLNDGLAALVAEARSRCRMAGVSPPKC